MDVTSILFYVFSAVLLASAFMVVTSRNTVHATLYLMLAFFQASMVWMLLRAEFLAITLVLVYLGAVMVLFLFVVMMLDINTEGMRKGFWRNLPLAAAVGALMAAEIAVVVNNGFASVPQPTFVEGVSNTHALGRLLYTEYLYPLEVAAVLLLVAIIAAIALTLRGRKDTRNTVASEQVKVRKSDRLRIVKMDAVVPVVAAANAQPTSEQGQEQAK
ncbi:MAG: NADH-quinone oxidoreductase subunit J [Burkholderiaceae bacterium]|jgi:NADH-quinone oxidoreductase subunit J|nr:NADH-quinone oxidoreductase subunit J [Burkholderiaceae bacterium]